MDPVDDVVAGIERADAVGTHDDPERVAVPCRLEGLIPPAGPVQKRRAYGLGRAGVEVVHDRLDRIRHRGTRIDLLEPMAPDEAPGHVLLERGGVVLVLHGAVARAGVENPGLVPVVGQLHEGVMESDRRGLARCRYGPHALEAEAASPSPARLAHERQLGLQLRVGREGVGHFLEDHGPARVEAVRARPHPLGRADRVPHEEVRHVHQDASVGLGRGGEAPQHRPGERVAHRTDLRRVVAAGPEAVVRLNHEDLPADALELDDARSGERAPVEPEVVRPESRPEAGEVDHLRVQCRDLHPELTEVRIPVQGQEAVHPLHSHGPVRDRGKRLRVSGLGVRGERSREKSDEGEERGEGRPGHGEAPGLRRGSNRQLGRARRISRPGRASEGVLEETGAPSVGHPEPNQHGRRSRPARRIRPAVLLPQPRQVETELPGDERIARIVVVLVGQQEVDPDRKRLQPPTPHDQIVVMRLASPTVFRHQREGSSRRARASRSRSASRGQSSGSESQSTTRGRMPPQQQRRFDDRAGQVGWQPAFAAAHLRGPEGRRGTRPRSRTGRSTRCRSRSRPAPGSRPVRTGARSG